MTHFCHTAKTEYQHAAEHQVETTILDTASSNTGSRPAQAQKLYGSHLHRSSPLITTTIPFCLNPIQFAAPDIYFRM